MGISRIRKNSARKTGRLYFLKRENIIIPMAAPPKTDGRVINVKKRNPSLNEHPSVKTELRQEISNGDIVSSKRPAAEYIRAFLIETPFCVFFKFEIVNIPPWKKSKNAFIAANS